LKRGERNEKSKGHGYGVSHYISKKLPALVVTLILLATTSLVCTSSDPQVLPHSFVVYGDTRTGHSIHERIIELITKMEPLAVFHTGDLVEDGADSSDWVRFRRITDGLTETAPFYPALGNHDLPPQLFFENFDLPNNERWYLVEVEGLRFIVLDTTDSIEHDSEQYLWLEEQLQVLAGETEFLVVVCHHPPFSTGPHLEDERGLGQYVVPLFEQYGVDIVFSGHDHSYQRCYVNGIHYVVTAGGGAPLYDQARSAPWSEMYVKSFHFCTLDIANDRLVVAAYDLRMNLIDQFMVGVV